RRVRGEVRSLRAPEPRRRAPGGPHPGRPRGPVDLGAPAVHAGARRARGRGGGGVRPLRGAGLRAPEPSPGGSPCPGRGARLHGPAGPGGGPGGHARLVRGRVRPGLRPGRAESPALRAPPLRVAPAASSSAVAAPERARSGDLRAVVAQLDGARPPGERGLRSGWGSGLGWPLPVRPLLVLLLLLAACATAPPSASAEAYLAALARNDLPTPHPTPST